MVGCSIPCIHSIPFPSDETRVCVRAREGDPLPLRSLESEETAFLRSLPPSPSEEEVTIFAAGSLARVHLGYGRHTGNAGAQIFPRERLSRKGLDTHSRNLWQITSGTTRVHERRQRSRGTLSAYARAAATVWFWLVCHYWCGTERSPSLSLCHSSTKLLLMGIGRTDGRTTKPRPRRRERERGRRFKTYGAEEAALLPRS